MFSVHLTIYRIKGHAGQTGHDTCAARHAPSRAAPSPSSKQAARLAQRQTLCECAHVNPLHRMRPTSQAQPKLKGNPNQNKIEIKLVLSRTRQTYSTISPLHSSAVHFNLGHTDQLTKLLELGPPERLRHDVRELTLDAHERQAHRPTIPAPTKKINFCINVLRAIV